MDNIEYQKKYRLRHKNYFKKYYQLNKEEISKRNKKYLKEYHKTHKQEDKKYREIHSKEIKEYRNIHKEEMKEYKKKYYLEHKVKILKESKKYNQNHKQKIKEYLINYFQTNNEVRKQYKKWYEIFRRETDNNYKILCYLRSRMYHVLKNNIKSSSTVKLIGCSIEQLRGYLEKQFTTGMNWNNYGKWHVDHIKPCASFDLSKSEEQRKCFNWKNLQPLWAEENLRKGANLG